MARGGSPATKLARRFFLARGGSLLSFIAILGSMFWPWTSRGNGSSVPGHRLASLLLSGRADLWAPRWVGAALFLVPLSGSIGLASVAFEGRRAAVTRISAVVVAAAISIVVLEALRGLSLHRIGLGGALALGGSVGATCFIALGHWESQI